MRGAPLISAAIGGGWVVPALFLFRHTKKAMAPRRAMITITAIIMPTSAPVLSPDFLDPVTGDCEVVSAGDAPTVLDVGAVAVAVVAVVDDCWAAREAAASEAESADAASAEASDTDSWLAVYWGVSSRLYAIDTIDEVVPHMNLENVVPSLLMNEVTQ